jgi:DNA-binding MarR family transcriptional regulator
METGPSDAPPGPPSDAETYRLDDQVGFLLRLANQRHAAIFQAMAPDGLTRTQFAALARLAELGRCSQNELGRRTAMDVATIKGVVDRLRAKGMVRVSPDPDDKRRSVLSVAPETLARIAAIQSRGLEISAATVAPLSAAETRALLRLLSKIAGP